MIPKHAYRVSGEQKRKRSRERERERRMISMYSAPPSPPSAPTAYRLRDRIYFNVDFFRIGQSRRENVAARRVPLSVTKPAPSKGTVINESL